MFDARRFLESEFGTPQRVQAFLRSYGIDPPREYAIEKWFRRSAIPSTWLPVLLAFMEIDRAAPVSLGAYLTHR